MKLQRLHNRSQILLSLRPARKVFTLSLNGYNLTFSRRNYFVPVSFQHSSKSYRSYHSPSEVVLPKAEKAKRCCYFLRRISSCHPSRFARVFLCR
jgi:hypothetical protein